MLNKISKIVFLSLLLASCATKTVQPPSPPIPEFTVKSPLSYNESYNRIVSGAQKCYPGNIIDHDLFTYKPEAEISISSHPGSVLVPLGYIVSSYNWASVTRLNITIKGQADKTSIVTLNSGNYSGMVNSWLKNDFSCTK